MARELNGVNHAPSAETHVLASKKKSVRISNRTKANRRKPTGITALEAIALEEAAMSKPSDVSSTSGWVNWLGPDLVETSPIPYSKGVEQDPPSDVDYRAIQQRLAEVLRIARELLAENKMKSK